uniref:JmjC domain-containing protein n=1 Tax=Timema cristinae TaxID=61476 RepID=A0A7R9CQ29_TIMCR|nr:unnamed protein product [Timema cristinae]
MEHKNDILNCLQILSTEANELYLRKDVPVVNPPISALDFHRLWVSPNLPVLFKGAVTHWSAVGKWDVPYFRKTLSDNKVTVAVTPNGYADAIATRSEQNVDIEYFVMPEEREMNMSEFLDALEDRHKYPGVFYVQRQNSNLTEDFPELMREVEPEISWASEAFGCPPEAVNLWVGDERAITSMHKDPYENIYCVVSGYKDFILLPPTDRPWIPYKSFPVASYKEVAPGHFEIVPRSDKGSASRQTGTPQHPHQLQTAADEDELFVHRRLVSHPVTVRVEAGDALYLPSLWYHHVRQSHACIAVNYWYDMQYDIKYAYSQLLEALVKKCHI